MRELCKACGEPVGAIDWLSGECVMCFNGWYPPEKLSQSTTTNKVSYMTTKDYKRMGKNNRAKGHAYELKIVRELKAMGVDCGTSRQHSRERDDAKVDIFMLGKTPLNIQCKNNQTFKSPIPILASMPNDNNHNVVFQHIKNTDDYVTMKKEDFYEIVDSLIRNSIWSK